MELGVALKDVNGGDFGHTKEDLVAAEMVHRRFASSALCVSLFCLFAVDQCSGCDLSVIGIWGYSDVLQCMRYVVTCCDHCYSSW